MLGDHLAAACCLVKGRPESGKVETEAALAEESRKVVEGVTERKREASGRRASQAPAPSCEQLTKSAASRRSTVPGLALSKPAQSAMVTIQASLLTTAASERCERREAGVLGASPNRSAGLGSSRERGTGRRYAEWQEPSTHVRVLASRAEWRSRTEARVEETCS
jgi:hypothetical protein